MTYSLQHSPLKFKSGLLCWKH